LQLSASPLTIESVRSFVFSVDFPEQTFQFCDFGFRYVGPDFEIGEMRPQFSFSFAAGVCFQSGLYSGFAIGHSNVDDIVFLDPRTMPVLLTNLALSDLPDCISANGRGPVGKCVGS
jgi:hypothetical protein